MRPDDSPVEVFLGDSSQDISAINNSSTMQDTSLNMTQMELIRKLHNAQMNNNMVNDNFDVQSSTTSYVFNDDEMEKYEEHIQQKINDIWHEIQNK